MTKRQVRKRHSLFFIRLGVVAGIIFAIEYVGWKLSAKEIFTNQPAICFYVLGVIVTAIHFAMVNSQKPKVKIYDLDDHKKYAMKKQAS